MLRLKKLVIHRFRDVVPGTTLEFADGVNAIIGLNGTGKTTLLNLASAVIRCDFSAFREEELDIQVWMRVGPQDESETFKCSYQFTAQHLSPVDPWSSKNERGQRPKPRILPRLSYQTEGEDGTVRLSIKIGTNGQIVEPKVHGATPIDLYEHNFAFDTYKRLIFDGDKLNVPYCADLVLPESVGRIDEAIGSFRALTEAAVDLPGVGPQLVIVTIDPRIGSGVSSRSVLATSLTNLLAPRVSPEDGAITGLATNLGLAHLPAAIGAEEVEFRFSPESDETRGDTRTLTYEGCDLWARWSPHSQSKHTTWSFGQKRMAAFCYYAACAPEGVILADELTNGLHHSMVETCFEIIGERQAILATQNPLLLDHMAFESADHMRRSFVLCELKKGPRGERQWIWRNPTEDEAESFFRAYQVDVSHVSEILRSKGLW